MPDYTPDHNNGKHADALSVAEKILLLAICLLLAVPIDAVAMYSVQQPDSTSYSRLPQEVFADAELVVPADSIAGNLIAAPDSVLTVVEAHPYGLGGKRIFNPSPERAVWMSALLPGLGQIYNRRYWKLPIVVGGFMGLGYATGWNNNQYQDYTQGCRDLLDSDPDTKSYMNFFPPNTREEDLDKSWLTQTMKSRKDYYRRNRDLCIICMVGLYLLCMLDAYVDASLAHFDISPNLSVDVQPAMLISPNDSKVAVGMNWAFNF